MIHVCISVKNNQILIKRCMLLRDCLSTPHKRQNLLATGGTQHPKFEGHVMPARIYIEICLLQFR